MMLRLAYLVLGLLLGVWLSGMVVLLYLAR